MLGKLPFDAGNTHPQAGHQRKGEQLVAKAKVEVKVPEKILIEIEEELFKLGDPKWVFARYQAAAKEAMKPVFNQVFATAPKDTGNLKKAITLNSRRSRKKKGVSSARVGVGSKQIFVRLNKSGKPELYRPADIINAIEYSKSGKAGTGWMSRAQKEKAKPRELEQRIRSFINVAIKKRTKFLINKRKKAKAK
jgi:hypothetical protein